MKRNKCLKCGTSNYHEDNYCENCLCSLIQLNVQEFYNRWNRIVVSK
ncbi:hypothetical protein H6503_06095 [Candidatus Woesearchaeota archaeon]|nr:hypothetical protein [Candidatus Woesearchaeota archaeon]